MDYLEQLRNEKKGTGKPATPSQFKKRRVVQDITPPGQGPLRVTSEPKRSPPEETRPETVLPSAPLDAGFDLSKPQEPELDISVHQWEPEKTRRGRMRWRLASAAILLFAVLGAVIPTAAFPSFSVIIIPKRETVAVPPTEFIADTALATPAVSSRRLPAIEVVSEHEVSREYISSGTKTFTEHARGTVRIYNAYSSSPQVLVANTRLQNTNGTVFRLQKTVTVPGASVQEGKIVPTSVSSNVIADAPGEAANIGPSEFRIPGFRGTPKYDGFYAKSDARFEGGFSGEARVVGAGDIKSASEELTREAIATLENELAKKLPSDPDIISPVGGRELTVIKIDSPAAGERRDRFTVSVKARGRVLAVRHSHIGRSIAALLTGTDPTGNSVEIAPSQPGLEIRAVKLGPSPGEARLSVSGELVYWREGDRSAIAAVLAASTPRKAEAYLRGRDEIDSFRIKRFPRWLWFIPGRTGGLNISVEPPV